MQMIPDKAQNNTFDMKASECLYRDLQLSAQTFKANEIWCGPLG